jgi:hypothetical protein
MADLFNSEDNTTSVDPNKDYLSELVGEGKKFADAAALARSKAEADAFIERVTRENATLREEVQKRKTVEEIRDQIVALRANETPLNNPPNHSGERDEANLFDQSTVERLVADKFTQLTQEQIERQNLDGVIAVISEKFGPGYQAALSARAKELGLGEKYLTDLAKAQPKAFLAIMGEGTREYPAQVNTARTVPASLSQKKGWTYYENIRKTDFHRYNQLQGEMFKALSEQGEDFYKN